MKRSKMRRMVAASKSELGRVGRPPKNPQRRLSHRIVTLLTKQAYTETVQLANGQGLDLSEWLRMAAEEKAERERSRVAG